MDGVYEENKPLPHLWFYSSRWIKDEERPVSSFLLYMVLQELSYFSGCNSWWCSKCIILEISDYTLMFLTSIYTKNLHIFRYHCAIVVESMYFFPSCIQFSFPAEPAVMSINVCNKCKRIYSLNTVTCPFLQTICYNFEGCCCVSTQLSLGC